MFLGLACPKPPRKRCRGGLFSEVRVSIVFSIHPISQKYGILGSSTRARTLLRRRCTCAQRVASCRREGFERPRRRMPEGAPMSTEENKAVARRWSEKLWGEGELAVADEI